MKRYVVVRQHDETDCGAACLASIAKYYGKTISISKIRIYAGTDVMGTSGAGILKGAEKLGFSCRGMLGTEGVFCEGIPFPVICHVKKGILDHYVVVYGKKGRNVIVADPAEGIVHLREEAFYKIWTKVFFIILPEQKFSSTKETKGLFLRFFYLLKPYKKTVVECFVAGIMLCLMGAASAFYFRFLIDDVLYSQLKNTLSLCSLAYLFVILFQTLMEFSRNQLMNYMGNKIDMVLVCDYFRHILRMPMSFFSSRKTGEILSRVEDTSIIRHTISSTSLGVVIDSCMLLVGGFFLFIFGSSLVFVAIIPVIISALLVCIFIKPFRKKIKEQSIKEAEKHSSMLESINGILTIKALSSEKNAFSRTEGKITDCARRSIKLGTMANIQHAMQSFVSSSGTLLLYWIGSLLIFEGKLSLGQLISFVTLSGYFLGPLGRLLTLQQSLQEAFVASDRLSEIMDMDEEDFYSKKDLCCIEKLKGHIEVKNLTFSYGTRGSALKNVSFLIKPCEKVAFVGTSGSGKTTLTKLLMKFYKPDSGSITVDGINLDDIDTISLRDRIGYVPQETLLFSGSIIENITWGSSGKSMDEVIEAAQKAQASAFIERLPDRYRSIIGEKGSTLSGGERQRISLARVLLRKPELLILDEATASLDSLSEKAIMKTVNFLGNNCTMIIVAHRLSTIKNCDRIFVFDKGSLVESGSHSQLLKNKSTYFKMWNAQQDFDEND